MCSNVRTGTRTTKKRISSGFWNFNIRILGGFNSIWNYLAFIYNFIGHFEPSVELPMDFQGIFESSNGKNDVAINGGEHSIVISVVENRAREICICKIDTQNVRFFLKCAVNFRLNVNHTGISVNRIQNWKYICLRTIMLTTKHWEQSK